MTLYCAQLMACQLTPQPQSRPYPSSVNTCQRYDVKLLTKQTDAPNPMIERYATEFGDAVPLYDLHNEVGNQTCHLVSPLPSVAKSNSVLNDFQTPKHLPETNLSIIISYLDAPNCPVSPGNGNKMVKEAVLLEPPMLKTLNFSRRDDENAEIDSQ